MKLPFRVGKHPVGESRGVNLETGQNGWLKVQSMVILSNEVVKKIRARLVQEIWSKSDCLVFGPISYSLST